jgi:hypothetical protein
MPEDGFQWYDHEAEDERRGNWEERRTTGKKPPFLHGRGTVIRIRMEDQLTFLTLPDRIQRVHACIRTCEPCGPTALIDCKFGFDTFFVLLFE